MRVCVTERPDAQAVDLRPAGELAPSLALPWIIRLRYGIILGLALLIVLTHSTFGVTLPIAWTAIPLLLMAASNVVLLRFSEKSGARRVLGTVLLLDIVCLTALLALTGGPANPFSLLYLVQITLSAVVLSKEWTWGLGLVSVLGFGFLFPVHIRVAVFEAHHATEGFSVHLVGMWIAFAAGALLITVFIGKVSEALRRREQAVLVLQNQLARHERLASIVTLSAGAAHELGTPLATIAIASKELERYGGEDAGVMEDARLIRAEVERCSRILQQMSARSAEPMGEAPVPLDPMEFLNTVRAGFPEAMRDRIEIAVSGSERRIALPPAAARQTLTAMVKNALDASLPEQSVRLAAECDPHATRFTITDSGCGMAPETLNRIAEPFFTTKPPGRGMGLGAFLARTFAERLSGSLVFESEPGKGTRAVLELPQFCHDDQRETSGAHRR